MKDVVKEIMLLSDQVIDGLIEMLLSLVQNCLK
jgi:hypothetical protein